MVGALGRWTALPLLTVALSLAGVPAAEAGTRVVYDSDFGGYLPLVDGIERPDLVAGEESGRVPAEAREAARRTRRALRRADSRGGWTPTRRLSREVGADRPDDPSRRWLRRDAVVSDIVVLDPDERPISGARVFRYHDPSFYTVNEGADGARLYELRRYLPAPYPAFRALSLVRHMEPVWRTQAHAPVRPAPLDCDLWNNPWRRPDPQPRRPAVEFVGTTDAAGTLRAVSGVFNLRDEERFPLAIVPASIRIGYVVVADGYVPGFSETRYDGGGVRDQRTVHLLRGPAHELLASRELTTALRLLDRRPLEAEETAAELRGAVDAILDRLTPALVRVPERNRSAALREAAALLYERMLERTRRRPLRKRLAELAWEQTPGHPGRILRLAMELESAGAELERARGLAAEAIRRAPDVVDAYPLHDRLLEATGAGDAARRDNARRCLAVAPFDPWARGRLAALELRARRPIRAFDHLRYTFMTSPGFAGDEGLARELADYFWRLGLPEKAGTFLWMLTGRPPEDPFIRVRGTGR
jgi:hypothetical protein